MVWRKNERGGDKYTVEKKERRSRAETQGTADKEDMRGHQAGERETGTRKRQEADRPKGEEVEMKKWVAPRWYTRAGGKCPMPRCARC